MESVWSKAYFMPTRPIVAVSIRAVGVVKKLSGRAYRLINLGVVIVNALS